MIRAGFRLAALLALAAGMSATPGSARMAEPPLLGRQAAGEDTGLICVWAIQATMLQIGRQCGVSRPAVEAELARSVAALEAYARRQSPQGAAIMDRYRADQIDHQPGLCREESVELYRRASQVAPEVIRSETEGLLAASPPVEWGTCL